MARNDLPRTTTMEPIDPHSRSKQKQRKCGICGMPTGGYGTLDRCWTHYMASQRGRGKEWDAPEVSTVAAIRLRNDRQQLEADRAAGVMYRSKGGGMWP